MICSSTKRCFRKACMALPYRWIRSSFQTMPLPWGTLVSLLGRCRNSACKGLSLATRRPSHVAPSTSPNELCGLVTKLQPVLISAGLSTSWSQGMAGIAAGVAAATPTLTFNDVRDAGRHGFTSWTMDERGGCGSTASSRPGNVPRSMIDSNDPHHNATFDTVVATIGGSF